MPRPLPNELVDVPAPRSERWLIKFLLPVFCILSIAYIVWRISITNEWPAWYAYPILISELFSLTLTIVYIVTARRMLQPVWRKPIPGASVDIFIPTYNEPLDIVKMTAVGAQRIKGIGKVFILDDGNRPPIKELAQQLGVEYVSRPDNLHAKAGNMNNGIKQSTAEFMIFVDCDHVPQSNIIERLLGYFRDPELAFVQTPQVFYNLSSLQFRSSRRRRLWNEQSMFYESINPAKNAYNAAFFCGSGAMLRRSAIDSVGGFATGTATEDIHTSLRLHAKGWKSLFINEVVAHGISAEDMHEYHKQRVRWAAGSLGLLFRSADSPVRAKGLTPMQRLCYIYSTITHLSSIQRLFYIILPPLILLTLPWQAADQTLAITQFLVVSSLYVAFSFYVMYIFSRKTFHPLYTEQFNTACILSHLIAIRGILNVQKKFKVSSKTRSKTRESITYQFLLVLFALSFLGLMFGLNSWFIQSAKPLNELFDSLTGSALFWNAFNMGLLGSILWFINRHEATEFSKHAIAPYKYHVRTSLHQDRMVQIKNISLRGADIITDHPINSNYCMLYFDTKHNLTVTINSHVQKSRRIENRYLTSVAFPELHLTQEAWLIVLFFEELIPHLYAHDVKKRRLPVMFTSMRQLPSGAAAD